MEIKYGIKSLVEESYKFNYDFNYSDMTHNEVGFQIGHSLQLNKKDDEIIVRAFARAVYGDSDIELASDSVRAAFVVKPFDSVVEEITDEGVRVSNAQLVDTFINVAIGALRGIFAKNLKNTPLDGHILPLIPMGVIHDNAVMKGKRSRK